MILQKLQEKFNDYHFDDPSHSYSHIPTKTKLTPTTTFKKRYMNGFENSDFWLTKKAKENGLTKEEMQEVWDEKRIVGVIRGSIIHDYAEHMSWRRYVKLDLNMTGMATLKRQVIQFFKEHKQDYTIATEFVCGDIEWRVGGMIDRLFIRDGKLWIGDWKTDSKIDSELKKSYGKKMKGKLSHMDDCILNGYFIQLNIYRQILEKHGFEIEGMEITHFCIHNQNYTKYTVPKFDIL